MRKVKKISATLGYGADQTEIDARAPVRFIENRFLVAPHGEGGVLIHKLPIHAMTRVEALELAAHLVECTDAKYHSRTIDAQSPLSYFLLTLRDLRRQNK